VGFYVHASYSLLQPDWLFHFCSPPHSSVLALAAHCFKLIVSFVSSTAASAMHVVATLSADLSFSNYVASFFLAVLYVFLVVATFFLYRKQLQRQQELESSIKLLQGKLDKKDEQLQRAATLHQDELTKKEKQRQRESEAAAKLQRESEADAKLLQAKLLEKDAKLLAQDTDRDKLEKSAKFHQAESEAAARRAAVFEREVADKDMQLLEKDSTITELNLELEGTKKKLPGGQQAEGKEHDDDDDDDDDDDTTCDFARGGGVNNEDDKDHGINYLHVVDDDGVDSDAVAGNADLRVVDDGGTDDDGAATAGAHVEVVATVRNGL
jgi:cbb3-type cytochrome oxidase subunit 3